MKIAVVGSSGFVGKHLVSALETNHKVLKLDKNNFDLLQLSKEDKTLEDVEVVVNLAGCFYPPFKDQVEVNVVALQRLLENCVSQHVRKLIHLSTAAAENSDNTYGLSKKFGEEVINFHIRNNGLKAFVLRPPNVYGPGSDHGVVYHFYKNIKEKNQVTIYGDGKQTRDFLYVSDLVSAIESATINDVKFKILEIGLGKAYTLLDLVSAFEQVLGTKIEIDFQKSEANVAKSVVSDPTAAKKILGWSAKINLEEGIAKLVKV